MTKRRDLSEDQHDAFRAAWADPNIRREDVARMFRLSLDKTATLAIRLGLGRKPRTDTRGVRSAPKDAAPVNAGALLRVPASIEDAQDWLYAEWLRRGCRHDAAMERLRILTPCGLVRECNALRVRLGLSPYQVDATGASL